MRDKKFTCYAKWTLFAFIVISVCVMGGCQAAQAFFEPAADGGPSQADALVQGAGPIASAFGPYGIIGTGVATAVAGIGGMWARNRGKKLKKVVPAMSRVVKGIDRWKADNPTAWEELGGVLGSIVVDEDHLDAIDHFRRGKKDDPDLKGLR